MSPGKPNTLRHLGSTVQPPASERTDYAERRRSSVENTVAITGAQWELLAAIESQDPPVRGRLGEVTEALVNCTNRQGIVLLQGETGSGKSVYSPVAIRDALERMGRPAKILVVQPRKDAAHGIAKANAAVLREPYGKGVGVSTSEQKDFDHSTQVMVMTSGVMIGRLLNGSINPDDVGAIMVDEIHEGSIDYHLILGLLKQMYSKGKAPLILLTSATLNKQRIQEFFGIDDTDYLKIEGRTHSVATEFVPILDQPEEKFGAYIQEAVRLIEEIHTGEADKYLLAHGKEMDEVDAGDILVFMPGVPEINELARLLELKQKNPFSNNGLGSLLMGPVAEQKGPLASLEILTLHGQLDQELRNLALSGKRSSGKERRVIIATNVAETSVTVPGIRYVVDSCRQRVVRYNPETRVDEFRTEYVSRDQAEQRAGRAGRVAPGHCYRLIAEHEFNGLSQHPESEISRVNLAHTVLRLIGQGIDPVNFPFIEPPNPKQILGSLKELRSLGAVDERGSITDIGREMVELPFEPRLSRMLVEARHRNCLEPALVLAAFENVGDVFSRNNDPIIRSRTQASRTSFNRGNSDWLKNLNIFEQAVGHGLFETLGGKEDPKSRKAYPGFKSWCKDHHIKPQALQAVGRQILNYSSNRKIGARIDRSQLAKQCNGASEKDLTAVILSGYADQLFEAADHRGNYVNLSNSTPARISPGSINFSSSEAPAFFITGSVTEGKTRMGKCHFAHSVHPVNIDDLLSAIPYLLEERKNSFKEPYPLNGYMVEQVDVYLKGKSKSIGSKVQIIKGPRARQAFARVLAEGRAGLSVSLPLENLKALEKLKYLYAVSGGRVNFPKDMTQWYAERLGEVDVCCELDLIDILNEGTEQEKARLHLRVEDYCSPELKAELDQYYPDSFSFQGKTIPISYEYDNWISSWMTTGHRATLNFDNIELGEIGKLSAADIPQIGAPSQRKVLLEFKRKINNNEWEAIMTSDFDRFQIQIEGQFLRKEWAEYRDRHSLDSKEINIDSNWTSLPRLEDLGYQPVQYATRFNGEPAFAYPTLKPVMRHTADHDLELISFELAYLLSKNEADDYLKRSRFVFNDQKEMESFRASGSMAQVFSRASSDEDRGPTEPTRGQAKIQEEIREPEIGKKTLEMTEDFRSSLRQDLEFAEVILKDVRKYPEDKKPNPTPKAKKINRTIHQAKEALIELHEIKTELEKSDQAERMQTKVGKLVDKAVGLVSDIEKHKGHNTDWPARYKEALTTAWTIASEYGVDMTIEEILSAIQKELVERAKNSESRLSNDVVEEIVVEVADKFTNK